MTVANERYRTRDELEGTTGMYLMNMRLRRPSIEVTAKMAAPGYGGDVWYCQHDDGEMVPYIFTELEPLQ